MYNINAQRITDALLYDLGLVISINLIIDSQTKRLKKLKNERAQPEKIALVHAEREYLITARNKIKQLRDTGKEDVKNCDELEKRI